MATMPKTVRIYRWRSQSPYNNFGDEITIPILWKLFGIRAVPARLREAQLLGAGSILDAWARTRRRKRYSPTEWAFLRRSSDLHVWGTGFMLPDSEALWPQRLHFHAIRGPLTAERIGTDLPVGDPGILAPLLLDSLPEKAAAIGLVLHHNDFDHLKHVELPKNWTLIAPEEPVEKVVSSIASCELIISSSLHGLITADSFGIPCLWAQTLFPLAGRTNFKFHDYATARGNPFNEPATYSALLATTVNTISDQCSIAGRSMSDWQNQLLRAFPHEF